ncbi:MAG: response regulator transcription factor [Sphingobacteriales bacterium]|nr:MAG: response regulator transcription factor [Sphingobacteriales bacterium]
MIDKVIIAEDHETANLSVQKTMEELKIADIHHVYYCDDAYNRIALAKQNGRPFDLLITDLYFEEDGNRQKIAGGFDLVRSVRQLQPEIMILIFSAEHRPATINMLFETYEVDAYVRKARNDARELKAAIESINKGQRYYPHSLAQELKKSNSFEFTDFDINIIRLLSQGYQQNEIPTYLQQHNIRPNSLSMIEKRLKQMKHQLDLSKNEQLVLFCKEAGIL